MGRGFPPVSRRRFAGMSLVVWNKEYGPKSPGRDSEIPMRDEPGNPCRLYPMRGGSVKPLVPAFFRPGLAAFRSHPGEPGRVAEGLGSPGRAVIP